MTKPRTLPANLTPRAVCREDAAGYLSISPTHFNKLVRDGLLPQPMALGGRRVWDVRALDRVLDRALDAWPESGDTNPWDTVA